MSVENNRSIPVSSKSIVMILSGICFLFGGSIYLFYRTTDMYMFAPLHALGLTDVLQQLRSVSVCYSPPDWVVYCLPDGLWLLSYMLLMDAIWRPDRGAVCLFLLYALPLLTVVSELMQMVGWIPGVGDMGDLVAYVVAILLFHLIKYVAYE